MFKSLYSKLAVVLLGLFALTGALVLSITWFATQSYQSEVNQKLNRALAQNIVGEKLLLQNGRINQTALEEVFHMLMVINPSIELYLLDTGGAILAYSAPPGKVTRARVDLAPLRRFIDGDAHFPMYGDDPRDTHRRKVFSAAPILDGANASGFLYVILGGEDYEGVAQKLSASHILRVSHWVLIASLGAALLAGLVLFGLLTRKLRRLSATVDAFRGAEGNAPATREARASGDEIDRLGANFHAMAQNLREQMDTLQRTDALRRELIANVSHDLRTPLATLQGYVETLLLKEDKLNGDERRDYLEIAIQHCRRLNKRVTELFELAKLDARDIQVKREPFSLAELVQDTVQKFQLIAKRKGVRIGARIDGELPFVHADIALVERVLDNLIDNALRHTPVGGNLSITLAPGANRIAVRVSDTGSGIPAEDLPRVFDRFYQVDKSRNNQPGSSGLGLAISKRIVELHGGAIDVASVVNVGTTFSFDLPVHYAS